MDLNQQKAQFSIAYIKALAAPLGFNHSIPVIDEDSVDISFFGKDYSGKFRNPELHIQMKCTAASFNNDGTLHFQIKKKNFNDLCGTNVICPRYLIIVLVPNDSQYWVIEKVNRPGFTGDSFS